jgi:hypothetical protein
MTASTRQLSHIRTTSSRSAFAPANIQCVPSSLATMRSTVLFVPNGLSQRMQWNGSSSLTTRRGALQAWKSSCGVSVITFSGQVAAHNPHCTQAFSAKYKAGCCSLSESAPVGQADTHERHSVQPSTLTSRPPKGAAAGNATRSTGVGATRCSSVTVFSRTSRFLPIGRNVAGRSGVRPGITRSSADPSASGSSASINPQTSGP